MKTTRKCFAFVLVLLMVMSSFTSLSFTVSAAEAESTEHRVFPRFEISETASKYGKLNMYTNGALTLDRSTAALKTRKADSLPSAYSSVDAGYITSVKNQGKYGTCWAFAANAASEASLIKNNGYPKNSTNFSPAHTAWWTYSAAYDKLGLLEGDKTALVNGETPYDNGGLSVFAAYTFAKGTGPAKETTIPYGTYAGKTITSDKSWQASEGAQLKNAYWVSYQNREDVKKMLMQYGAGVFGYYSSAGDSYKKSGTYNGKAYTSYACVQSVSSSSSSFKYSDHDVTLVGWDDNFPKENFASACKVTQNGAWLIKNSWGTSEGASGYFWVSYQDSSNLADDACFFEYETEAPYENIYQYDGTSSMQYVYDDCGYMANVFTADSNETLKAVSFFTVDTNVKYTVEIYKNVSTVPTSGSMVSTVSGQTTYMQYKTVELPTAVQIDKNEKYAVVVKFENGGGEHAYLPVDCTHRLQSTYQYTNATKSGISYYSTNKSDWTDVSGETYTNTDGTKESNYSFRIKAFTDERATPLTGIALDKSEATASEGSKIKLTASAVPSDASLGDVTWTSSNSSVATVANGIVTCVAEGTATITAACGSFTATCTVTVTPFEGGFTPVTKQSDVRNNREIMLVSEYDGVKYALQATAGAANNTLAGYAIEDSAIAGNTDETLIWIAEANGDGTFKLKSKSEGTYLTIPSSGNGLSLNATGTNLTLNDSLFFGTSAKGLFFVNASLAYKSAALSNATSSSYTVPVTYVYATEGGDPLPEYTVSFETDGNGTVTCNGVSYSNGQSVTFEEGTTVALTAVPNDGYEIDEWLVGSETPSGATYTFTISANTEVTAFFKSIAGEDPTPLPDEGEYLLCTDATLESGRYIFVADYNGTKYAMTGGSLSSSKFTSTAVTIENNIVKNPESTFAFDIVNTGSGYTVYDVTAGKYVGYSSGTNFNESDNAYKFNVEYSGGMYKVILSTASTRAIILNVTGMQFGPYAVGNVGANYKLPALYKYTAKEDLPEPVTQYDITLDITGNGTIGYNGNSYSNGQKITVDEGTTVTLTAVADNGYQLNAWLDNNGDSISGTSYTTTVNSDITITAEFKPLPQKVAAVTAYPASGKIENGTTVYLSCSTPNSTIHYSYDGVNYSTYSNGAIVATTFPLTVYAYATADGYDDGDVVSFAYQEKVTGEDASGEYKLCTDATLTDGKYILAALVDGKYYAMLGDTLTSGKFSSQEITVTDGTVQDATDEMVFEIAATANGYSVYDTIKEQYIKYGGSSTNLAHDNNAYDYSVTYENDVYKIISKAATTRGIIYRAGTTNKFGGYSTTNVTATGDYYYLTLFKLDESTTPSEEKFTVSITVYGNGTVNYNGQSYSNGDTISINKFSEVTLSVTPDTGYKLESWLVGDAYPETDSYTFTLSEDTEVMVQFSEVTAEILATVNGGQGTVLINGNAANDIISVTDGSEVAVSALPAEDYTFSYMMINGKKYETSDATFTISGDTEIEVYFVNKYDFNSDNDLTIADVTYLLDCLTGKVAVAPTYADVNGDGSVNLLDAYVLYAKATAAKTAKAVNVKGDTVSTGAFEKVTDATTLAAGDQIIFVYNDKMMDSTFSSGKTVGLDVEHRGDYIANVDTSAIWTVAVDDEAADSYKYSFLAPDGTNYLTYDTSTNFKLVSSLSANNKFAVNTYTAPFTSEELFEISVASGRSIVYRTGTTNKFAAYAKSNLTNATNSKEYFGVYIYKYNPNLTFGDEQYTVTVSVAEGQEALGTVNEGATVFAGSNYTVTATPAEGYQVAQWTITAADGTVTTADTASYRIEGINQNYTAVVSFEELPPQPVGKYVDIKAIRDNKVVGKVKAGDVLRFSVNTPIVSTDLITYSYKFSEEAKWVAGDSYTVTGSEAFPFTIYVMATAEGCNEITGSKTFEAAAAFSGTFQKVTDISTLNAGDKIVLAYGNVAFDSEKSDNKFIGSEVTVDGDYITNVEPTAVWVFGIDETAADKYKYTFESNEAEGTYIFNANSTTINISSTAGKYAIDAYTNTVTNEDLFKIYNSNNRGPVYRTGTYNMFNAYAISNVKADSEEYFGLCIYKLVEGEVPVEPDYDLTGDGNIDINDVKLFCDYLIGLVDNETAVQKITTLCDFNEDGIIDLLDAYYYYDTIVKDLNLPAE